MSLMIESPVLVVDAHSPFVQAAKFQRSDVDVPDSIVDLLHIQRTGRLTQSRRLPSGCSTLYLQFRPRLIE